MSLRLKKNFALLRALASVNPRTRRAIISTSPKQLILAICEIVDNLLRGNVILKAGDRSRLVRYRHILRQIADKSISVEVKKKVLIQHGGALPLLLIPALTAIASLLLR